MSASPITLLIAALGGEGGGVLTGWIVEAAQAAGLPVQATSIPGVAQRTGATTYYIEIWPETREALGGREPVLALSPAPGEVDIMLASELLEAGRAIQTGLVTPDRTMLIASTHRVLTTREKMAMGDGRFDSAELFRAARDRTQSCLLADLAAVAKSASAPLGSVLLGALAGTGKLPIAARHYRDAIKAGGKAEQANLGGFEVGLGIDWNATPVVGTDRHRVALDARIAESFPAAVHETLGHAVARLTDYQDDAYARLYLDRLAPFAEGDADLLDSLARHLALWMSYEDIFRVAQAKIRPGRLSRILGEATAGEGDAVTVTEFFRPGFEEIRDALPKGLARWLNGRKGLHGFSKPMELRSTTIWGYLQLRILAALRRFRRATWRYAEEQARIEDWLDKIGRSTPLDAGLAREIAECARLIKGYGDTHRRGSANFALIDENLIAPALDGRINASSAAARIAKTRAAALADPDGAALGALLAATLGRAAE